MIIVDNLCKICHDHEVDNFSVGLRRSKIMVVTNRKSSGVFQKTLNAQLEEVGLDLGDIYFTPVIKCRDYEAHLTKSQLKEHAAELLIPEIEAIKPDFILGLGNEALQYVAGKSGIMKHRGKLYEAHGAQSIATVSPSAVKRNPGQMPGYMADLRTFANKTKGRSQGIPDPKYIVGDTPDKLKQILRILDMTEKIIVDVETKGGEYYEAHRGSKLISIAATCIVRKPDGKLGRIVWAIPLGHVQSVWRKIWPKVMAKLGQHIGGIKEVVAHNSSFDSKWMITYDMRLYPTFDTMLAIAILNENVQKGLKPQAQSRLGVEPWGIDTGDLDQYPIADVLHYNVLDTWYTHHVELQLRQEMKEKPRVKKIFELETMPAQRDLIDSEIRGAWIDVERLNKRTPIAEKKLADIEHNIRTSAELDKVSEEDWPVDAKGKPLAENFNASRFARWMLFEHLELPVLERGKEKDDGSPGEPSMAEDVLMALRDRHPTVEFMLDRVTAQKHLSSFFRPYAELYDEDHRIHTNFKLAGTVTGRLSSGKSDADKVSGTKGKLRGVNMQQVPRDPFIRGLFGAPPGWTFVEADYSQVELRVAALLADETTMKHIYATGGDIHTSTAARVAGIPESEVSKEVRKKLGKPVNFGFLYGMSPNKFISTAFSNYGAVFNQFEAKAARDAYFALYPKLLPWHAKQRRLVNKYGRVESPIGRIRNLPDIYSPDKGVRAEAERQAINSPVQGFASDMAVVAMIEINRIFRERGIAANCLGLVHDAINYEVRDDFIDVALPIIKDTMEDTDRIYRLFGAHIDIPIVADVAIGGWWGDKLELSETEVYDSASLQVRMRDLHEARRQG